MAKFPKFKTGFFAALIMTAIEIAAVPIRRTSLVAGDPVHEDDRHKTQETREPVN